MLRNRRYRKRIDSNMGLGFTWEAPVVLWSLSSLTTDHVTVFGKRLVYGVFGFISVRNAVFRLSSS